MKQKNTELAVVGMSCRFPGGATTPDEFWSLLAEGRDAVTQIDEKRWNMGLYYHPSPGEPGKTYTYSAGIIDNVYDFTADFFGISRREAAQIDPQQRLMLELAWEAL